MRALLLIVAAAVSVCGACPVLRLRSCTSGGSADGYTGGMYAGSDGRVYVAGGTCSTDRAVTGSPFQTAKSAGYTLFAERLNYSPRRLRHNRDGNQPGNPRHERRRQRPHHPALLHQPDPDQRPASLRKSRRLRIVTVTANGVASAPFSFQVVPTAPGTSMYGTNRGAVLNQDASLNTATNGASSPGSFGTVSCTGIGAGDNPVATGEPVPGISHPLAPATVTIGGQPVSVIFSGLTTGTTVLLR